jgi:hypothetical protein
MDEKIMQQLKKDKIRNMKNPVILMNDEDFEEHTKHLESKVANFKAGIFPKYAGIPIKTSGLVEKGKITIYDQSFNLLP